MHGSVIKQGVVADEDAAQVGPGGPRGHDLRTSAASQAPSWLFAQKAKENRGFGEVLLTQTNQFETYGGSAVAGSASPTPMCAQPVLT